MNTFSEYNQENKQIVSKKTFFLNKWILGYNQENKQIFSKNKKNKKLSKIFQGVVTKIWINPFMTGDLDKCHLNQNNWN